MTYKMIKDFDRCPHCGSVDGYYTKVKEEFFYRDRTSWSGEKMNDDIYDHGNVVWISTYYYCLNCYKSICKRGEL